MTAMLLDHLWQSTAVLAIIGLLTLFFRNNGAHVRHALWTAASLKFLVPFAALTALGGFVSSLLSKPLPAAPMLENLHAAAQPFSGDFFIAPVAASVNWLPLLVAVWAAGFLAVCGTWLARWRTLRQTLRAAADAAIPAPMKVKFSRSALEPGLVGIFRPVLLLPEGIAEKLSPAELNAILAHESCHLSRRDNLTAALHMLVEAVFWFWPPVWWLGTRLVVTREQACDEAVVAAGNDPQVYAESILKVCKFYVHSPLACAAGVSGADLKQRMEEIMKNTVIARLNIPKKVVLTASATALLSLPLVLGLMTAPPAIAQAANTPHPGTEAVLRRIINGALSGKPDVAEMRGQLAEVTNEHDMLQIRAKDWGALKAITFKGNDGANDGYGVEFEKAYIAFTIGPVVNGKIDTLFFGPAVKRTDNGPSPGLAAAIRRELDGDFAGKPAYEVMSPTLRTATDQQWSMISANAKDLGAVRTITFQNVNPRGWDVYHVTFANGSETVQAEPLTDGKLNGLFHSDILLPKALRHPELEASLRRYIESLEKGQPNYDEMAPPLANAVKQQLPNILKMIKPWGALQSIEFKGGGPQGGDIYDVTFEHAKAEWTIAPLDANGKVAGRGFHQIS